MLMKIVQFFKKAVGGSMILAALACPVFTSCADFSTDLEDVRQDLSDLEDRVEALEAKLNTDLAALQTLLESQIAAVAGDLTELEGKVDGLVTVKECKQNSKGEWEVTLTDGTKFTVYPEYEQDYSGIVTTTTIDGVLYWAVFDENGKAKAITVDGQLVPVVDAVPQTKKGDDGYFYVSFDGGETWEPTGVTDPCVFAGAELVYTDNYTDEEEAQGWGEETPMYVVFTLPDGNTISVTLDGVAGFMFGGHWSGVITSQYISCGTTTDVGFMTTNITDWIKEVPAGWKVDEIAVENAQYGGASFRITAPSAEAIASGAAVAEGTLKVLAVAEGGKTITAPLKLTTVAFSQFNAGKGKFTVQMNNGLGGYVVGVSTVADYDPEAIVAELTPLIEAVVEYPWGSSPDWPYNNPGYSYFDYSVEDEAIDGLMGIPEMALGEQYVVWALAVNSWTDDYNWGYTAGSIYSTVYNNVNVEVETTVLSFNDIQIKATFEGMEMFYGRFSMKYNDLSADEHAAALLNELNANIDYETPMMVNDEYVEGWDNGVFTGDPNALVNGWQPFQPGNTYFLYIIPYVEGKTKYSLADMYYYEWTTDPLMPGGSLAVTAGEATLDFKKISVPLSAEGATYIHYYFVDPAMIPTIADKQAYLLENGYVTDSESVIAAKANIAPNTTYTLLAMAVDQYGCYGDVFQKDYTTKALEFAAATVTAEVQGTPSMTGSVKVSCSAEVEQYLYWYGEKDAWQWTNASYLGGSAESASSFIALTPDSYLLTKVAPADIPAEGIEMTDLTVGSPCVFVISAKLTDGTYTKATVVEFEPTMNLGNFVYATDDNGAANPVWEAARPTVTYEVSKIGDFADVTWSVELPEGFKAWTACFHKEYIVNYPTAKDKVQFVLTYPYANGWYPAYEVVAGEKYSVQGSAGYDIYTVVCDAEGNYYEAYVTELNITGGFGV